MAALYWLVGLWVNGMSPNVLSCCKGPPDSAMFNFNEKLIVSANHRVKVGAAVDT